MSLRVAIEKYAVIFFCVALAAGILLPVSVVDSGMLLNLLMGFLLFVSFLNVDISFIKRKIARPFQLVSDIVIYFLFLPAVFYVTLVFFGLPEFALGVLLLTAMPAGLGSAAFTAMANGRVETSVLLSVFTHLAVPITVPLLFWLLADVAVKISVAAIIAKLALLIFLPLIAAVFCKKYATKVLVLTKPYHKVGSIFALSGVAYFAIIPFAGFIKEDISSVIIPTLGMCAVYIFLCLITFVFSSHRPPEERIALMISRTYMNNALAIVLAQAFFGPAVTLMMVLAEIPWFTTFGLYLWFQKRFLRNS